MVVVHRFGGSWTEDKLIRLQKYLKAYLRIFKKNPRAAMFYTTYVDAFAGTGDRIETGDLIAGGGSLFGAIADQDAKAFRYGSARIALDLEPHFDRYLFIDRNPEYAKQLQELRHRYSDRQIDVVQGEANQVLQSWCRSIDWSQNRAVVFLDPYGMQVEWNTMCSLAQTRSVDVWILAPLGQAINRLLTRDKPPDGPWADALTRFFGTDIWREAFYRPTGQLTLFGEGTVAKDADFDSISKFFVDRLKTIFAGVAENPLPLRNSKNVPIYLLCFAASNPRGAPTAIKIAQHILRA